MIINDRDGGFNINDCLFFASIAKLVYDDEAIIYNELSRIGVTEKRFINCAGSQAVVFTKGNESFVAFRGTEVGDIKDILADLNVIKNKTEFGWMHMGFYNYYKCLEEQLIDSLREIANGTRIYITGHSLGAAIASVFYLHAIKYDFIRNPSVMYLFGAPRVFTSKIVRSLKDKKIYRVVNNNDIVCRVPSPIRFHHVGKRVQLKYNGNIDMKFNFFEGIADFFIGKIVDYIRLHPDGITDHFMDSYIEMLSKNL